MQKILILLSLVILVGCSSGKKQLEKGNYNASIEQAINRLKKSPNNKKAKATLKDAYVLSREVQTKNINRLKSSNEQFKWDKIADSYDQLTRIYDAVWKCPACIKVLPNIKSFRNEFNEASNLAASERYAAGMEELAKGTRQAGKLAFRHFERVQYLKLNYKDTHRKIVEARDLATLKVLVDQIPVHSRNFGLSHEFFQNRLNEFLDTRNISEFVRFYSPAEADRARLKLDHVVVLQFDDFVVGQTYVKEHTREVSLDSVVVGTVKVGDETRDVYGTVEAEYTTFSKYLDSRGLLDMKIYDGRTDRILFQRKMPGQYQWVTEWATYKGDKRALTDEELKLTDLKEARSPSPQFLFQQFCEPIYSQASQHFRNFYRDY